MSAVREKTNARNASIIEEFNRLVSVKEFGKQKYSVEWVLEKLARQFYLSVSSVDQIVFKKGYYYEKKT